MWALGTEPNPLQEQQFFKHWVISPAPRSFIGFCCCSPRNELITTPLSSFLLKCLDFPFLPLGYIRRCRILSCQVFIVFFFSVCQTFFYLLLAPIITTISPSLNHFQAVSSITGILKFSLVCSFHKSGPDVSWCKFLWVSPLSWICSLVLALVLLFHCLPIIIIHWLLHPHPVFQQL